MKDAPPNGNHDLVEWTPTIRSRIEPSRRRGNGTASKVDPARAERLVSSGIEVNASRFVNGLRRTGPEAEKVVEAVLSALLPGAAPVHADRRVEAVRSTMLCVHSGVARLAAGGGSQSVGPYVDGLEDALLFLWVEAEGLCVAIEALTSALDYELVLEGDAFDRQELSVSHNPGALDNSWEHNPPLIWTRLRHLLAIASTADYEEARGCAVAIRMAGSAAVRHTLAYLFPDEPTWAADEAERVLREEDRAPREAWLLGSLMDGRLATAIARRCAYPPFSSDADLYDRLATIVDNLGGAAAGPVLIQFYERACAPGVVPDLKRYVLRTLKMIKSRDVGFFIASNLSDPTLLRIADAYFEKNPFTVDVLQEAIRLGKPMAAAFLDGMGRMREP